MNRAVIDEKGRAVVDLRWVIGKGRILPLTTMENVILFKRDATQEETVRELDGAQALQILEENGYYNPHLLVHSDFKRHIRSRFFASCWTAPALRGQHYWNAGGEPEGIRRIVGIE